ncbi:MAG: PAS domain S-box protein, partial [Chitinophagaceae bacterium]|nr:PAS domain S-box protein [Chitinophagaceae bacterium]
LMGVSYEVHSHFQKLYNQLYKAATLHPALIASQKSSGSKQPFYIDSATIINQATLLQQSVEDSVNKKIATRLYALLDQEIGWLLNANLPDSIQSGQSQSHLDAFKQIDSLIVAGIERTNFLIAYRSDRLNEVINHVRTLMIGFIVLIVALLIYTSFNFFSQRSKRRHGEKEMATVLNRMSDSVISLNKEWRYTFLNDAALATHPQGRQAILGKLMWEIHPQIKESAFWEGYQKAMTTQTVVEVESLFGPLDTWFSARIYPSNNGITIFYKDITQAKQAEQQLAQTIRELTDYKVALDESSIVAITDQKGTILHANDNFCRISGFTREELIGQDHRIINSGYHPKSFIRDLWMTIANGFIWRGELKNRAKDGTIYWVDTTIVPFANEAGKPYRYVAIRSDITARKLAEEKLVQSENIYKMIASSIPGSVICILDTKLTYLLIEGKLLEQIGYSRQQLLGKQAVSALPADVYAESEPFFQQALAGNTVKRESHRAGYDFITRYIPLKDDKDQIFSIMTVSIDVSELKNAQRNITELNRGLEEKIKNRTEQLKKSNEELEAFSYSVSHDLRAPLRGIIGFSAILQEEYGQQLDKEGQRITQVIIDNTQKMGRLIDDLLEFSRTGKKPIQKTTTDFNKLVPDIVDELSPPEQQKIKWEIKPLLSADVDASLFRQVWVNLLSNAIKYSRTKETPAITIGCLAEDTQTVYYIRDNGVGFDEAYKHKLFGVFQRLHDDHQFEGTGVGLALVDRIVTRHGGRVWAESKEGEGACFYFSLPSTY